MLPKSFLRQGTKADVMDLPFMKRGKCGTLPPQLTPEQITRALFPVRPVAPDPESSDGKVTIEWIVKLPDGGVFTVHDYKGTRWSVGGQVEAARAVLGEAFSERPY